MGLVEAVQKGLVVKLLKEYFEKLHRLQLWLHFKPLNGTQTQALTNHFRLPQLIQ
jgi:hypothetical protein